MKSVVTSILVLLCLATSIQADSVSWGNITASELSNLPISAFQDLSAFQMSIIPPEVSLTQSKADPGSNCWM